MPSDSGYVFDFETVQRIAKAVRDFERGVEKPGVNGLESDQLKSGESYIQITGARAMPGYYDGVEKVFRTDTGGWQYSATSCIAWEVNEGVLVIGETYKGTIKTCGENGKTVFAVQASGGGGTSLSTGFVEVGAQATPGTQLYTGWISSAAWYQLPGDQWARGDAIYIWNSSFRNYLYPGERYVAAEVGTYNGKKLYVSSSGEVRNVQVVTNAECDFGTMSIQKRIIATKG